MRHKTGAGLHNRTSYLMDQLNWSDLPNQRIRRSISYQTNTYGDQTVPKQVASKDLKCVQNGIVICAFSLNWFKKMVTCCS